MLPTLIRCQKRPALPKFFKEDFTLDHFILRGQVISLYRQIVRCTKGMNKSDARELIRWARADFDRHRKETDIDTIRSLLSSGKHQMHSLQSSVSLAQTNRMH
ncbi:MAG: hypothetical protein EXX96DRAFT_560541 [Benjaminiella poitrasii]|nr:MAG: hypothetical protein EXX96DRAFT_560541 [Benjaminiella poitrasii]